MSDTGEKGNLRIKVKEEAVKKVDRILNKQF